MAYECSPLPGILDVAVHFSILWTCAAVLLVKKLYHEAPERRWLDFLLDFAKQVTGAGWLYLLSQNAEECTEYWASVMAQTTLGLLINYLLLTVFSRLFERGSENPRAFRTGEYDDGAGNVVPGFWVMQVVLWLTCITCMKCLMAFLMAPYLVLADVVLKVISWSPHLQLVVVALWTPCAMYGLQAWITDDFLKKAGAPGLVWTVAQEHVPKDLLNLWDRILAESHRVPEKPPQATAPLGYEPPTQPPPAPPPASLPPMDSWLGTPQPKQQVPKPEIPVPKQDVGQGVGDLDDVSMPRAVAQDVSLPRRAVAQDVSSQVSLPAGSVGYSPGGHGAAAGSASAGASPMSGAGGMSPSQMVSSEHIILTAAQAAATTAERMFLGQFKGIKDQLNQREKELKGLQKQLQKVIADDDMMQNQLTAQLRGIGSTPGGSAAEGEARSP